MEKIWYMDKRKFLLKKDCNFVTNRYIILYIVGFFEKYTLFSNNQVFFLKKDNNNKTDNKEKNLFSKKPSANLKTTKKEIITNI